MPPDGPWHGPACQADRRAGDTEAGIVGAVVVQAAPTIAETQWLLRYVSQEPTMYGVVGSWLDLEATDVGRQIGSNRDRRGDGRDSSTDGRTGGATEVSPGRFNAGRDKFNRP
jgi:hypothetical protein